MKIISFDPGGTTGVVILDSKRPAQFRSIQIEIDDHHTAIWSLLLAHSPDKIIAEDFNYRVIEEGTRKGIELISRDYLGVIKLYQQLYGKPAGCELIIQKPAYAVGKKPFFTDEFLKRMGIYTKGAPHSNDAMRHLLMYLCFNLKIKKYLQYTKPNRPDGLPTLEVEYNSVG